MPRGGLGTALPIDPNASNSNLLDNPGDPTANAT